MNAQTLWEDPAREAIGQVCEADQRPPTLAAQRPSSSFRTHAPGRDPQHPGPPLARILVPTDFSPGSGRAVECAVALARQCGAALTLLHVIDINPSAAATESLPAKELMQRLWEKGFREMGQLAFSLSGRVQAQTLVEEGLPWEQIVNKSRAFDLVVLSKADAKPGWKLFSKRTALRVIENAACPVLVVGARVENRFRCDMMPDAI